MFHTAQHHSINVLTGQALWRGAGFAGHPAARNGGASHARDTRIKHAAPIK